MEVTLRERVPAKHKEMPVEDDSMGFKVVSEGTLKIF